MKKIFKISILALLMIILFSAVVFAEVSVNGINIDLDLTPDKITADTYLPLSEVVANDIVDIDKVNNHKFLVFYKNDYYMLESNIKAVKSNRGDRNLNHTPLKINGYFLVPVEFLDRFLNLNIESPGDLTMPYDINRDQSRDDLRLRIYLNDDEFDRAEELEVKIEILNISRDDISLRFNSAQKYNIYIKNRSGRTLYSWADSKIFSQKVKNIEIKGKGSLSFEEEISLNQFREGRYYIEVEIVSDNYEFDRLEKEFEIED